MYWTEGNLLLYRNKTSIVIFLWKTSTDQPDILQKDFLSLDLSSLIYSATKIIHLSLSQRIFLYTFWLMEIKMLAHIDDLSVWEHFSSYKLNWQKRGQVLKKDIKKNMFELREMKRHQLKSSGTIVKVFWGKKMCVRERFREKIVQSFEEKREDLRSKDYDGYLANVPCLIRFNIWLLQDMG